MLFINCVLAGEDKKKTFLKFWPCLTWSRMLPSHGCRGSCRPGTAAGVKQNECSDPEDHGMGWAGRDLKTVLLQPPCHGVGTTSFLAPSTCSKSSLALSTSMDYSLQLKTIPKTRAESYTARFGNQDLTLPLFPTVFPFFPLPCDRFTC